MLGLMGLNIAILNMDSSSGRANWRLHGPTTRLVGSSRGSPGSLKRLAHATRRTTSHMRGDRETHIQENGGGQVRD